jgi:hypothetical protein
MHVVYALICAKTGFAYVGSAYDLKARMRLHRHQLGKGKHRCRAMLADWQQHGESSFRMLVLEILPKGIPDFEMRSAAGRWQKAFAMQGRLYVTGVTKHIVSSEDLPIADIQRCLAAIEQVKRQGYVMKLMVGRKILST